jgi:hypothetical protein
MRRDWPHCPGIARVGGIARGLSDRRTFAPGEAWERGRDVGNNSKPFGGTQWAFEPTRKSLANSRKRVLRPCRRLYGRSVDSV